MLLSAHIAEVGVAKAMRALLSKPDSSEIEGMRYAQTWLTAELRSGMLPSLTVTGVIMIAAWDDDESLDRFLHHKRAKPYEHGWRTRMRPARSIGVLAGLPDLPRQERPTGGHPVAALTMAKVRANRFLAFVKAAGAAEREAATHPGLLEGITLIRPPLVIGTFSLWRNAQDMRQYALGSYPGGHLAAIKTDRERQFHHEMSFSRHIPYAAEGRWKGRDPLATLQPAVAEIQPPRSASVDDLGDEAAVGAVPGHESDG
jgi:hypothetical protein